MLLAVDPGQNSPGVALFVQNTPGHMLRHAARLAMPASFAAMPEGARWMHVAAEIVSWARARGFVDAVVFERPQWYSRDKSKGDPNQLAGVAGVAANVTGMFWTHNISVTSPTPADWIGQCPKVCPVCDGRKTEKRTDGKKGRGKPRVCEACNNSAWGTPRGRRIWSRLNEVERTIVPDQNDAIDAVGIGLWALGRLEKISVFSNGRDGR
jgi:hypothetical protein